MCGMIASIPGMILAWMDMSEAKSQGRKSTMGMIGMGLNVLGIVITLGAAMLFFLFYAMSMSTPTYYY